jgi:hypothetical protein
MCLADCRGSMNVAKWMNVHRYLTVIIGCKGNLRIRCTQAKNNEVGYLVDVRKPTLFLLNFFSFIFFFPSWDILFSSFLFYYNIFISIYSIYGEGNSKWQFQSDSWCTLFTFPPPSLCLSLSPLPTPLKAIARGFLVLFHRYMKSINHILSP